MTGKELVVVLGGAVAFGGVAGAAGAALSRDGAPAVPAAAPSPDSGLASRVASLEERLRAAEARRDELVEEVRALRERPVALAPLPVPLGLEGTGEIGATTGLVIPAGETEGEFAWDGAGAGEGGLEERIRAALAAAGKAGADAGQIAVDARRLAADAEIEAARALAEDLRGVAAGLGLRSLPEAERWEKARQDLGLTDAQVADLQAASAARAKAIDEAFVTAKSDDDGRGGFFEIRTLDKARADAAQSDWTAKRDAILGEDQRKGWKDKGYDNAFGGPAVAGFRLGGAATIELKAKVVREGDGEAKLVREGEGEAK